MKNHSDHLEIIQSTFLKMVGIIGGVGPLAGVDLLNKIIEETNVLRDQDHVDVVLFSCPSTIPDRTSYLEGKEEINPAYPITKMLMSMESVGCRVGAIACNTAHAAPIYDVIKEDLLQRGSEMKMLSLIEETVQYILQHFPSVPVGILSTNGTAKSGLYSRSLRASGIHIIEANAEEQEKVHQAIYHKEYGIKAYSKPVKKRAIKDLQEVIISLKEKGVKVIVLGCTEIPLALTESAFEGVTLIDPNHVLAKAIIQYVSPEKLKK